MNMTRDRAAVVTLPSDTEILITREFDAPPEAVYRVFTEPELVRRWWTARRGEMTVAEIDLRVGGRWRYAMLAHGRFEVAFHGEYLEIVPGRRIVSTEVFEGAPNASARTTTTFAHHGSGTLLTILVEHQSRADRDAHIESGMEDGLQDALELVDEVLLSLG
jgi:uncharacterized protein YndB with AHSA1/START domain